MKHIIIMLHFVSFTSGIGLITLAYFFYLKSKSKIVKHAILCNLSFTVLLSIDTLNLYARKIIVSQHELLRTGALAAQFIAGIGIIFFLVRIVESLIGKGFNRTNLKIYFFILAFILSIFSAINQDEIVRISFAIQLAEIYLYVFLIYNAVLLIANIEKIDSQQVRKTIKLCGGTIIVITSIMLSINIFDNTPLFLHRIPYMPLLYFTINTAGLIHIKKYTSHARLNENTEVISKEREIDDSFNRFFEEYGITEREKEIVKYVVEGYSNQEIGTKLYISPNTVKNHIYNIYRKIGIKNRYELMHILSKVQDPQ